MAEERCQRLDVVRVIDLGTRRDVRFARLQPGSRSFSKGKRSQVAIGHADLLSSSPREGLSTQVWGGARSWLMIASSVSQSLREGRKPFFRSIRMRARVSS